MKINHKFYSDLAFNLAEKNLGKTNMNPSVGCIVVKNNSVISSAVTSVKGRPHAEFNALNKNINFGGSNMYLTLEPCTHYGLTPPCTSIIKAKKIKKVFYSFDDPDRRTYRKAIRISKKIKKLNIKGFKHKNFYKSYFLNKKRKFPLIDAKLAISKDFYTISKKSKWITNFRSRKVSHLLRSKYDCIISTSASINKDNSLLNCRIEGLDNYKPDLIIIDRNLKLKKKLKLFNISNKRKTYVFTTSNNIKKISFLRSKKIKVFQIDALNNKNDFNNLFKKIYQIGKGRILIETGLVFLNKLLRFNYVNELFLFKTDKSLKSYGSNNCSIDFIKKLRFRKRINVNLENDHLLRMRIK